MKKRYRTQPTISSQLRKLEDLGIVTSRREGRSIYYRLTNEMVRKILELLKEERDV